MVGNPKYKYKDIVKFHVKPDKNVEFIDKVGTVYIVDRFGTFENSSDVSYDILVKEENCLYKHISEKLVLEKLGEDESEDL